MSDCERYGGRLTMNRPTLSELKEGLLLIERAIDDVEKEVGLDKASIVFRVYSNDKGDVLLVWRAKGRCKPKLQQEGVTHE